MIYNQGDADSNVDENHELKYEQSKAYSAYNWFMT